MINKLLKKIKLLIFIVVVLVIVWYAFISPRLKFNEYEEKFKNAAIRYYEFNSDLLPTGERVKTLYLSKLFNDSYLNEDFHNPYTGGSCVYDTSWVKVKKVNGNYKYFVYLDCGVLKSKIDHEGPTIKLNGDSEIEIGIDSKYEELGVDSIVDKVDGNIDVSRVTIRGEVDTSKVGEYELTYSASDSLNNKTIVKRNVKVVKKINSVVKKLLNGKSNFTGLPNNNYVYLSNILFRVYGLNKNNDVILVADDIVSFVSYNKLDEWLDYFYSVLTEDSKKLIVKNKFCNMKIEENELNINECNSYTEEKNVYVPSIFEVKNSMVNNDKEESYMISFGLYWLSNKLNNQSAYGIRTFDPNSRIFTTEDVNYNYGVRPMLVIKGDTKIVSGDGTLSHPYLFGDVPKAKSGDLLSTRYVGEYFKNKESVWRIVENNNGKIKAVASKVLVDFDENGKQYIVKVPFDEKDVTYNPKKKTNFAYFITNRASSSFDSSIFELHEFDVPIYKDKVIYGNEIETKKYKLKYAVPNMFEVFSYGDDPENSSYFINSSKQKGLVSGSVMLGIPGNEPIPKTWKLGIRIAGYVKDDFTITSGDGTSRLPYILK